MILLKQLTQHQIIINIKYIYLFIFIIKKIKNKNSIGVIQIEKVKEKKCIIILKNFEQLNSKKISI